MNKYNLEYIVNGRKVELRDITMEQAEEFIKRLPVENESSLQLRQIKKDEGEER